MRQEFRFLAGPAEAAAIGNIMLQAKALGKVKSLDEIREIIRNSFEVNVFRKPLPKLDWKRLSTNLKKC